MWTAWVAEPEPREVLRATGHPLILCLLMPDSEKLLHWLLCFVFVFWRVGWGGGSCVDFRSADHSMGQAFSRKPGNLLTADTCLWSQHQDCDAQGVQVSPFRRHAKEPEDHQETFCNSSLQALTL